jgi:hypothetical protein
MYCHTGRECRSRGSFRQAQPDPEAGAEDQDSEQEIGLESAHRIHQARGHADCFVRPLESGMTGGSYFSVSAALAGSSKP